MAKALLLIAVLALTACALPQRPAKDAVSACDTSETSYECQVERYHNISK